MGSIVIAAAILAWIQMADIVPMLIALFVFLEDEVKKLIQMISELTFTITLMAVSAVLSSTLGAGRASSALVLIFVGVILWQIGSIAVQSVTIRTLNQQSSLAARRQRSQADETGNYLPSAPPGPASLMQSSYGSTGQYNRPVMLLPDLREMRLHETHRRDKVR